MSQTSGIISDHRDSVDAAAAVLMVLLTFSWGVNYVAMKVANEGYNPVFLSAARSTIGGALVFLWCRWRGIRLFEKDGSLLPGLLVGALFGVEFVLIFFGLDFTTAARGALMINTMPFWVLIGGHFMLGERITPLKAGGLTLAFAGVVMVFFDELSLPDPSAIWGDVMCLAAGVLWALTILVIKDSKLSLVSAEKTLLYQLAVSAVIAVPLIPIAGPVLRDVSMLATGSLLFQSVYVVAFTFLLWFWLIRRYPASGLSSFTFLSPAFGVLCGAVLLGEPLSWRIFGALVLIAVGLIAVNWPGRRMAEG